MKKALESGGATLIDMKEMLHAPVPPDFRPPEPDPDEMALMIYFGGTTGIAKGIMLSHSAVVANAHQVKAWGHLTAEEQILAVLPLFHGYGMSVCMNAPVLSGMEIVLMPKFSAGEIAKTIHKHRPTLAAAVPTILVALSSLPDADKYAHPSPPVGIGGVECRILRPTNIISGAWQATSSTSRRSPPRQGPAASAR